MATSSGESDEFAGRILSTIELPALESPNQKPSATITMRTKIEM